MDDTISVAGRIIAGRWLWALGGVLGVTLLPVATVSVFVWDSQVSPIVPGLIVLGLALAVPALRTSPTAGARRAWTGALWLVGIGPVLLAAIQAAAPIRNPAIGAPLLVFLFLMASAMWAVACYELGRFVFGVHRSI